MPAACDVTATLHHLLLKQMMLDLAVFCWGPDGCEARVRFAGGIVLGFAYFEGHVGQLPTYRGFLIHF